MLPFQILKKDYFYDEINAQTEVYGVVGDPIEQSLSPAVHNAAFRYLGLNKVMVPFLVPDGELPAFFKELLWTDIKACSVTIPHKEAIVPLSTAEGGGRRWGRATQSSCRAGTAGRLPPIIGRDGLTQSRHGQARRGSPSPLFRRSDPSEPGAWRARSPLD
jgi:hypothetical protein